MRAFAQKNSLAIASSAGRWASRAPAGSPIRSPGAAALLDSRSTRRYLATDAREASATPTTSGQQAGALPPPATAARACAPPPPPPLPKGAVRELCEHAENARVEAARDAFRRAQRNAHGTKQPFLWNLVLKAHAKAGDVGGAKVWFEEMLREGRANTKTIGKLLLAAANAGLHCEAERWVAELAYPPVWKKKKKGSPGSLAVLGVQAWLDEKEIGLLYCTVATACVRAGDTHRVLGWVERLRSAGLHQLPQYHIAMDAHARQGDYDGAERWLHNLVAARLEPDMMTRGTLLNAGAVSHAWEDALRCLHGGGHEVFDTPVGLDETSCNIIANACAKRGDPDGAADWLGKMEEAEVEPTVVAYNTVLSACAQQGDTIRATEWFGTMLRRGVTPNEVTYTTLISSCARRRDSNGAVDWFNAMTCVQLRPSEVTYGSVINAFAKRGDTAGATWWLHQMEGARFDPSEICYTAVIDSCAKRGDVAEAAYWVRCLTEARLALSVHVLNAAMASCAVAGDARAAVECLGKMSAEGLVPDAISYNTIISSHAKGEDPAGAARWLRSMADAGFSPNVISYNTVVAAYARAGDPDAVAGVLEEMTAARLEPTVVTWTAMLTACGHAIPRRASAAERVFQQMRKCGVRPNKVTYLALGRAVGHRRRVELWPEE